MFEKRSKSLVPGGGGRDKKKQVDKDIPLIIWLNGGPGCSSSLGLLTENGPCSVNEDGETTKVNPYSWTESAHVLWLDQPAHVGYSYGEANDYNTEMISEDVYYFLQVFFKSDEGKKYEESPLFIVGESYAGHYAPAIAHRHRIWMGNKDVKEGLVKLNLAGVSVGNGLTDPEEQYQHYAEMAYNNYHKIKAVPEYVYTWMKRIMPQCKLDIAKCNSDVGSEANDVCEHAHGGYCHYFVQWYSQHSTRSMYDMRKSSSELLISLIWRNS